MFLRVWNGPSGPTVSLESSDDLGSLKIVIAECLSLSEVRLALADVADLPDRHEALVDVEALRKLGNRNSDPLWDDRFSEMIVKAERAGWVTDSGGVRAHCEWPVEADGL